MHRLAAAHAATAHAYQQRLNTYAELRQQGLNPHAAATRLGLRPRTGEALEDALTGMTPAQRKQERERRWAHYDQLRAQNTPRAEAARAAGVQVRAAWHHDNKQTKQKAVPC